jgi:hypothetical protein
MKIENIEEYMENVTVFDKNLAEYFDKEKGVKYVIPTPHLITRVDYLELTDSEYTKAKFEQKVDNLEYKTKMVDRPKPKYEVTKKEEDRYTIINSKVKVHEIWNVSNGLGIKQSFDNKEDALKLNEKINEPIIKLFK